MPTSQAPSLPTSSTPSETTTYGSIPDPGMAPDGTDNPTPPVTLDEVIVQMNQFRRQLEQASALRRTMESRLISLENAHPSYSTTPSVDTPTSPASGIPSQPTIHGSLSNGAMAEGDGTNGTPTMHDVIAQMTSFHQQPEQEALLRQTAESSLASLENSRPAGTTTAPSNTLLSTTAAASGHTRTPRMATPDRLNGIEGIKAEAFASHTSLYLLTNTVLVPSDSTEIVFALSSLSGETNLWGQPLLRKTLDLAQILQETSDRFSSAFRAMFFDTDQKNRAEKDSRTLRQDKNTSSYVICFIQLAPQTRCEIPMLITELAASIDNNIHSIDNDIHGIRNDGAPIASNPSASTCQTSDEMDLTAMM